MSIKWLIPVFLLIACLAVLIGPAERFFVRMYMQVRVEQAFSGTVTWKNIRTEGDALVWEDVEVGAVGQIHHATIDAVRVTYSLNLWHRQLTAQVDVIRPTLLFCRAACSRHSPHLSGSDHRLNAIHAIQVTEGRLGWHDGERDEIAALFDVSLDHLDSVPQGTVNLGLVRAADLGAKLAFAEKEGDYNLSGRFQALPLDLAVALARTFSLARLPLQVQQGTLTGQVTMPLPWAQGGAPQGQLALDNTAFSIDGTPLTMRIRDTRLSCAPPLRAGDQMLLHIQGSCLLEAQSPDGEDKWELEGVRGQLSVASGDALQLALRGQWWHEKNVKAFRFDGSSSEWVAMQAAVAFTNPDGAEGRLEFTSDQIQGVSAQATHLDASEAMLVSYLLQRQWSNPCRLTRGTVDGHLTVEQGACHLQNFCASDFELCHPKIPHALIGKRLQGNVLLKSHCFDVVDLQLVDGILPGLSTDIQASCSMREGACEQVSISGCIGSREGTWNVTKRKDQWQLQSQCAGAYVTSILPLDLRFESDVVLDATFTDTSPLKGYMRGADGQLDFVVQLADDPLTHIQQTLAHQTAPLACVRSGHFKTTDLPCKLLKGAAEGTWRASGSIGDRNVITTVTLNDFALADSRWRFEAARGAPLAATVKTALEDGRTQFSCPIKAASLIDRQQQLVVSDITGDLRYHGGELHLARAEASCEGIELHGDVSTSIEAKECRFLVQGGHGTVSQLKQLLTKYDIDTGPFHKLPVDGIFVMGESSADLTLVLDATQPHWKGHLTGEIRDATIPTGITDVSVRELGLRFSCFFPQHTLTVTDLQGTVLVGRPGHRVEEYRLASDRITFSDYPFGDVAFDLWMGDKRRDVLRVAGKATPKASQGLLIQFDTALTHFGTVHPKKFALGLVDWTMIHTAQLEMAFDLGPILRDLQRVSRIGLSSTLKQPLEELLSLKSARGSFHLSADYDRATPKLTYFVRGEQIALDDREIQTFLLKGSVRHNNWMVDQLLVDDVSVAADMLQLDDRWKVNFLGLRCGRAVTLGLEGEYYTEPGTFEGRINLLDIHLHQLQNWKPLQRLAERFRPQGEIRAQGNIALKMRPSPDWVDIQANLYAQTKSVELLGLRLRDCPRIATHYYSEKGFTIEELSTALIAGRTGNRSIPLRMERVAYSGSTQRLSIEGGSFQLPKGNLGWVADLFKDGMGHPGQIVSQKICQRIDNLQPLEGRFSIHQVADGQRCALEINEGLFRVAGQPYAFKQLSAHLNPHEMMVSCCYHIGRQPIWFTMRNQLPMTPYGQVVLSDQPLGQSDMKALNPMTIGWRYSDARGFELERVLGTLCGAQANLNTHPTSPSSLFGTVRGYLHPLFKLLPDRWEKRLSNWRADANYELTGVWGLSSIAGEGISFDGRIISDRIELAGYRVRSANAQISYSGNRAEITQLLLQEGAAKLSIPEIALQTSGSKDWSISVPTLTATDLVLSSLKIPSDLQKKQRHEVSFPTITLENISGVLTDPSSFVGVGSARFNYSKRNRAGKGLLGMTADLMSRVGLDWDLVTPTTGIIEFQIADGGIVLTRLKDVYSQGKLAKYSLVKEGPRSTIGFDGKLDVSMRLKPTQPFLKVADKLTILLKGTVQKPECTFQQ